MSARQLALEIESLSDGLNILQQHTNELPQTQKQSEQIEQTFVALQTSLERLTSEFATQPPTDRKFSTGKSELQALFDESLDAMLIADDAGCYVDANPAACELLGLSREKIITKSVADFTEPSVDSNEAWQQFLEQGRVRGEFRILRPDGTVRETEYAAVANFVPHRHLSILRDITERNQIQRDLLKKQQFIEQIAESMPAILYVYDLSEQQNVYVNRQLIKILGYSPETVQERGTGFVQTLIHPDDRVKVVEGLKQLATARDGEIVEAEYRMRHNNGEWRWLYSRDVVLTRNTDGTPQQLLGTATDITRLKQTEQQLRQSQEMYRALNEVLEQQVEKRTAQLSQRNQKLISEISERKRLEQELRASQQKYKTLFDILPVGISICDGEGKLIEVNQIAEEMLGVSVAEHNQQCCDSAEWQIIRPDGSMMPNSEYACVLALTEQRIVRDVELGMVKPDGEISWLSVTASPIPLEHYGVAVFYMDITKRKQAEIALRQSEEQLRLITDSLPVCISYVDQEQRYRFVNKTYEVWFGCNRNEIYGRTLREFVGETAYSLIQQYNERVLAGEMVYYESEVPYRLGGTRYICAILVPDFDTQSHVRGWYSLITDITDRKRAEIQLVQTRNFLQSVLDHLPVAVFAKETSNLRYVLWNPAFTQLMGYTAEEALGKTDYDLFQKQQADCCTTQDRKVLDRRQVMECLEELIWTNQGQPKIIRNKKVAICNEEGNSQFLLGFAEDVTERKQAEDRLRSSLQEKEVLLAELHHRVKNNLYVICSLLELQSDQLTDLQAKAVLEECCNRVISMALIHELSISNRDPYRSTSTYRDGIPHSSTQDVFNSKENRYNDISKVDFAEYVQQLALSLLETYESPASQVMLNFDGDEIFLSLDQAIPCGLLLNELITNALKHGFPEGSSGYIYIRMASIANGWIELAVGNDGDYLPPDFDIEQNASMGLKLVMMFVEQLTGCFQLEIGEMTWFKVRFPQSCLR